KYESCAWRSKGTSATITPVNPPMMNVDSPPNTNNIGTVQSTRPTSNVAMKQKLCTPVRMGTAADAARQRPSEPPGKPVVNIWGTQSPKLTNPVPTAASTTHP